jgi:hypothetical protein
MNVGKIRKIRYTANKDRMEVLDHDLTPSPFDGHSRDGQDGCVKECHAQGELGRFGNGDGRFVVFFLGAFLANEKSML